MRSRTTSDKSSPTYTNAGGTHRHQGYACNVHHNAAAAGRGQWFDGSAECSLRRERSAGSGTCPLTAQNASFDLDPLIEGEAKCDQPHLDSWNSMTQQQTVVPPRVRIPFLAPTVTKQSWSFMIGSALFAVGTAVGIWDLGSANVTNVLCFIGAWFFTAAGLMQVILSGDALVPVSYGAGKMFSRRLARGRDPELRHHYVQHQHERSTHRKDRASRGTSRLEPRRWRIGCFS